MSDLTLRADDRSVQIMSGGSARFRVRVTSPKESRSSMIFSDFILTPDDDARAVEALHLLKEQFHGPASAMRLVFQGLPQSFSGSRNRAELIRRHDQIVSVVKAYADQVGLTVENAFLEPKAGKFETVVLIA